MARVKCQLVQQESDRAVVAIKHALRTEKQGKKNFVAAPTPARLTVPLTALGELEDGKNKQHSVTAAIIHWDKEQNKVLVELPDLEQDVRLWVQPNAVIMTT
jgi:hypothetical protein